MGIYKYLAPERIQVLENATLRATQANALNDPFELKPFFNTILERADLEQKIMEKNFLEHSLKSAYMDQPAYLRAKLPWSEVHALSLKPGFKRQINTILGKEIDNLVENQLPNLTEQLRTFMYEQLGETIGIISFSEVSDESLMWAHYAKNHKGFVVEFDENDAFFDRRRSDMDEFFHLRPVEYHDKPPVCRKITDLNGAILLCGKQARWSYERERRVLIPVDPKTTTGQEEAIHLITFPRRVVRAVVLGHRASNPLIDKVQEILSSTEEYAHVHLRVARADLSTGNLVIEEFNRQRLSTG